MLLRSTPLTFLHLFFILIGASSTLFSPPMFSCSYLSSTLPLFPSCSSTLSLFSVGSSTLLPLLFLSTSLLLPLSYHLCYHFYISFSLFPCLFTPSFSLLSSCYHFYISFSSCSLSSYASSLLYFSSMFSQLLSPLLRHLYFHFLSLFYLYVCPSFSRLSLLSLSPLSLPCHLYITFPFTIRHTSILPCIPFFHLICRL